MSVDASSSVLQCRDVTCGAQRVLHGTVFDDSQFYSQEGQKAKSGTFKPNRHFQFWLVHLLAREPEEELGDPLDPNNIYGEKVIAAMRRLSQRDGRLLRLLTVADARGMLRELGQTHLNKNVALLLKKLTGVGPPHVSDAFIAKVENLFQKVIEASDVRREGRTNRNYYPDYIYRIVEWVTTTPEGVITDPVTRRLLYYIYIQSADTVQADDADWERICSRLPPSEIQYRPIDRECGKVFCPI